MARISRVVVPGFPHHFERFGLRMVQGFPIQARNVVLAASFSRTKKIYF
jgi:hypothetical protein